MVVGVTMVRDELDVLPATLAHMLAECDAVIVADNGSTDGTYEMLMDEARRLNGPLLVLTDFEVGYYQSRKVTRLAGVARDELGAEWVVPWDADEVWLSRGGERVADALAALPESVLVAEADLWDHVSTARDPDDPNPVRRMRWRRSAPAALPKVAVRARRDVTIAQGNHSASFDGVDLPGRACNLLTVRHFPYRSAAQTVRKVRNGAEAYAATVLGEAEGAHWRGWGAILADEGERAIEDLYLKWHWREEPRRPLAIDGELQPPLVLDPAPVRCAPTC